jgi:hypothetical protein
VIPKAARVSLPSVGVAAGLATSDGLLGLGDTTYHGLSPAGGFLFLVLGFIYVFFRMVRRQRYAKVGIRSSPLYPRFASVPRTSGGRVVSCVRRILLDLFNFHYRWCGFRSVDLF